MDEDRPNEIENTLHSDEIENESKKEMALQNTWVPKARRGNSDGERVTTIIK